MGVSKQSMERFHDSNMVLSLYFHNPSKHLFEKTIKWLQKENVNFISTQDLLSFYEGEKVLPKSPVLLTVDDGWKTNKLNIVEIANAQQIPITIFITTEPVLKQKPFWWTFNQHINQRGISFMKTETLKRWTNQERTTYLNGYGYKTAYSDEAMDEYDIKEVEQGGFVFIESHTVTHPILPQCTDHEAEEEISNSKLQLEKLLGKKIQGFAYPNGSFGPREIELLKKYNYRYGFTTKSDFLKLDINQCLYTLPRIEVMEQASFAENICRITGVWKKKNNGQ